MSNEIFNPFSLKGKTILVTGASSGIGQAIAIETAKAGAEVILSARNLERLQNTRSLIQESCGQEARIVAADLTQQSEIENLVAELPEIDGTVCVWDKVLPHLLKWLLLKNLRNYFPLIFALSLN
jgi:short-subunit dehydrogenase